MAKYKFRYKYVLASYLCLGGSCLAEPVGINLKQEAMTMVAAEWATLKTTDAFFKSTPAGHTMPLIWELAATPAFPDSWPPRSKATLVFYMYGRARDPETLKDGEHILSPWREVTWNAKSPKVMGDNALKAPLKNIGIQGVRPIETSEIPQLTDAAAQEELVKVLSQKSAKPAPPSANLKAYYCFWLKSNGTILSSIISQRQKGFLAWLHCS